MTPDQEPPDETAGQSPSRAGTAAPAGDFWTDPDHDDTGLDLARALAQSPAGAATMAPRKKRRKPSRGPTQGKRGSGAHPDDRDPQMLDTTLGRLVADQGWAMDLGCTASSRAGTRSSATRSPSTASPSLVRPTAQLVVRTDSTAWATQMRLLAPTVVRRLNEELGRRHGDRDRGRRDPTLPDLEEGPRSVRDGRGPRDTYG